MNKINLEIFCRVIEEGSISQAARVSFVSQPAVTNKIRQLEKHYGAPLFKRYGSKLELTEAGTTLYIYAKEIIDHFNKSEEVIKQIGHQEAITLNIGANLTIGEYLLPFILSNFQKQYEHIKFNVTIGKTPSIISLLENRKVDIALIVGKVTREDLKVTKFGEDELVTIVPADHRLSNSGKIHLDELIDERFIYLERKTDIRNLVDNLLKENNILNLIKNYMELGSIQSIKSAVEAGLGVSMLPKLSLEKELEMGILKQIELKNTEIIRDMWIVQLPCRFPKDSVKSFISYIHEYNQSEIVH